MNQDWEWEDLLDDKPASKKEPEKTKKKDTGKKSGSKKDGVKKDAAKKKTGASSAKKTGAKKKTSASGKQKAKKEEPVKDVNTLTEGIRNMDGEAPSISGSSGKKGKGGKKKRRRRRGGKVFWICYAVFVLLLVVAGVYIVRNVQTTMVELHDNAPETFIRNSLKNLRDEDVLAMFQTNTAYETKSEAINNIRSYLEGDDLSFKRVEHNVYEAYRGDKKLFDVRLNATRSINKLGLLNYDILESCAITPLPGGELYHYEIKAPSTCEITVNGKPVGDPESKETVEGFADAAAFVELPSVNTYVIDHLTKEPDIRATDNGMEVPVALADEIDLTLQEDAGHVFATTQEAGIDFDALEFARLWTMFNRNDLTGDLHGYYTIEDYLIKDSQMCILAYQYATSQDIGWTSNHVLLDPPFTDEEVSNVIKYDDHTASVDVALKMHMVLDRGAERTDSIHTTLYLIKTEAEETEETEDGEEENTGARWKVINTRDVE